MAKQSEHPGTTIDRRARPGLSVRVRVVAGFCLLVAILVAVTLGASYQTRQHQADLEDLQRHSVMATLLLTAEAKAAISAELLQRYVYTGDEAYVSELNAHASAAQAALNEALARGGPEGLDQVVAKGAQLQQGAAQAQTLRQSGNVDQASAVIEELVPVFHEYRIKLEEMSSLELSQESALRVRADDAGRLALWLLVASGAIGASLGVAVSYQIARSIIRPLASLEATARSVVAGDLTARASTKGPSELSHMGVVLNQMMSAVEARTADLREANRKLLTQNTELTDARMQASTDPLTGLGNHRSFHNRLRDETERASRAKSHLGLVIIDLDGFKEINDSLGHLAGDQLLRDVAAALVQVSQRENTYRYGGDELAVLLPEADEAAASETAERLRNALKQVSTLGGRQVTASLGVACFPNSADTPEELVYRADMAMYWAKSSGKNRVSAWDEGQLGAPAGGYIGDPHGQPDVVTALCVALGAKDPLTRRHVERCSKYANELAVELGLSEEEAANVRLASLLHDIGKLVVPDEVLNKPGPLTDAEMDVIKRHPVDGASMLSHIDSVAPAVPAIRHHHEHFDGSGYPDGLVGEEIPLAARILLVVDAFDAVTSHRPYGAARPSEEGISELKRCSGGQFDPQVVDAFVGIIERGLDQTPRHLKSGTRAVAKAT
ncbi:MAG: HD domain-containing phosphohydrolase [Dehalococcoidia bacterium]